MIENAIPHEDRFHHGHARSWSICARGTSHYVGENLSFLTVVRLRIAVHSACARGTSHFWIADIDLEIRNIRDSRIRALSPKHVSIKSYSGLRSLSAPRRTKETQPSSASSGDGARVAAPVSALGTPTTPSDRIGTPQKCVGPIGARCTRQDRNLRRPPEVVFSRAHGTNSIGLACNLRRVPLRVWRRTQECESRCLSERRKVSASGNRSTQVERSDESQAR